MRKFFHLIFLFVACTLFFNSCNKATPSSTKDEITAEKTSVKTYEIINLTTHQKLSDKYTASFGSVSIQLLKTSDSTLTFYVPDVSEGTATLKFDLATIDFTVIKTALVSADVVLTNLTNTFVSQVNSLSPTTPEEIAEVNNLDQYRQEVISLFNSLNDEQKRQALLFYEANKSVFQSFSNNTFSNFDAPTAFRKQSDCPKTNYKAFYDCTGENLSQAAKELGTSSKDFLFMLSMAGVSAYLAPASFGLSAAGTVLGLGTAGYLLLTEMRPASLKFKEALFPYLSSRWVFSNALFDVVVTDFQNQVSTSLNLTPKFRTLAASDKDLSVGTGYFIKAMSYLEGYWVKLTSVFGNFPSYTTAETPATLTTADITISNVSNANVQYVSHTDQSLIFKSVSGKDESFTYKVKVSKEGFVEEKTLSGQIKVSCPTITFGTTMSSSGSIAILNVQGGVAPYMFSVSNSAYQSSEIFVGPYASGNSYQIKIKDANNCETIETRVISKDQCGSLSTFTDPRDGQTYRIVTIGTQTWFAENLRYSIGNSRCYSDDAANCNIYGRLYDWETAKLACPPGYHLPTQTEWETLYNYLYYTSTTGVGGIMKSTGTQYWQSPNTDATNSSCFSGLPGGIYNISGSGKFEYIREVGNFWSSTDRGGGYCYAPSLVYINANLGNGVVGKTEFISVRCIKD